MPNPFSAFSPDANAWSDADTPESQVIATPGTSIATPGSAYTPAETPNSLAETQQNPPWLPASSWDYYLMVHYDPSIPPEPQSRELAKTFISIGDFGRKEYIYKFLESVPMPHPQATPRPPLLRLDLDPRVQLIPMSEIQDDAERNINGYPWVCVRTYYGGDEACGGLRNILRKVHLDDSSRYDGAEYQDIMTRIPQLFENKPLLWRDARSNEWSYHPYEAAEEREAEELEFMDSASDDEDEDEEERRMKAKEARVTLLLLDEIAQRTGWVRVVRLCCRGEVCFDERMRCFDLAWIRMTMEYGMKSFDELIDDLVDSNGSGEGELGDEGWGWPDWCEDGEREMLLVIARGEMEGH